MKTVLWLVTGSCLGVALLGASGSELQARTPTGASAAGTGVYSDGQIGRIKRAETTESELVDLFGAPETRQLNPDGRASLAWSWRRPGTDGGASLVVKLSADGKVEAYSARQHPVAENRTVEFVEETDADMRTHMDQWRNEGWSVLSVSKPLPQPDGTVKRKANLSRGEASPNAAIPYDDAIISGIRRGETTQAQLLKWFGPACSRELQSNGRMELLWKLGNSRKRLTTRASSEQTSRPMARWIPTPLTGDINRVRRLRAGNAITFLRPGTAAARGPDRARPRAQKRTTGARAGTQSEQCFSKSAPPPRSL